MKRLAYYTIVVGVTLSLLYLTWLLRSVVGIFVLSLFAAATLRPIIRRLRERGLPNWLALAVTYGSLILLIVAAVVLLLRPLTTEAQALIEALGRNYDIGYARWSVGSSFEQAVASRLPSPDDLYASLTADEGRVLAQILLTIGQTAGTVAGALGLVLVVSLYWTIDQARFERLWLSLVAPSRRVRARTIWRTTEWGIGSYIRNEGVQSVLAFVFLYLGFSLMGIRYPTILALVGSLAWVIPIVGFLFVVVPAFLGGLTVSPVVAAVAAVYVTVVLLVLELVVQPRLFRRRLYSPLMVLFLIVPLAETFGILGLLAAPPLAVAVQTLLGALLSRPDAEVSDIYPSAQVVALGERLDDVKGRAELDEAPELGNIVERLDSLLQDTTEALRSQSL